MTEPDENEVRRRYRRRKKLSVALYGLMALLMLSLGIQHEGNWPVCVFLLTGALVWAIFRLRRCPKCRHPLPGRFYGVCPQCGTVLEDPRNQ